MKASRRSSFIRPTTRRRQDGWPECPDCWFPARRDYKEKGELDAAFEQYLAAALRVAGQVREWYPILSIEFRTLNYRDASGMTLEWEVYARLPAWATRPGQTPERLIAAARQLEETICDASASDEIKVAHLRMLLLRRPASAVASMSGFKDEARPSAHDALAAPALGTSAGLAIAECVDARTTRRPGGGQNEARDGHMISHSPPLPWLTSYPWLNFLAVVSSNGARLCPAPADRGAAHLV